MTPAQFAGIYKGHSINKLQNDTIPLILKTGKILNICSLCMFKIKFPAKRIFTIFPILRINGMAPFCNLFIERPSYITYSRSVVICYF